MLWLRLLLFLKLFSLAFILNSVAASFPKLSLSKQKSWRRMQSFPTLLVRSLFFLRTWMCYLHVWCVHSRVQWWTNNIRRHYETHHDERCRGLQGQPRREKVKEAAVKASYLIANDIALASKPYCEGELVKTCILKAAEIVCSKKLKFLLILAWRETLWQRRFRTFPRI